MSQERRYAIILLSEWVLGSSQIVKEKGHNKLRDKINVVYPFLDCGKNPINSFILPADVPGCVIYLNTQTTQNFLSFLSQCSHYTDDFALNVMPAVHQRMKSAS